MDTSDAFAVQRMVNAFASSLGANKTDDSVRTRELLVDTLTASAAAVLASATSSRSDLSEAEELVVAEAVSGIVSSMAAVTGAADQLSPRAMDEGISLLANLGNVGLRAEDAASAAASISNLLSATATSFSVAPESTTEGDGAAPDGGEPISDETTPRDTSQNQEERQQAQRRAEREAAERGERLLSILENVAVASTKGGAAGDPVVIETDQFALAAQTASSEELETEGLVAGDNKVDLPAGALASSLGSTTAQVVKWTGAGPHFWAGNTLGNRGEGSRRRVQEQLECTVDEACYIGTAVLATNALTVNFFREDGSKLAVNGLSSSAELSLQAVNIEPPAVPDTIPLTISLAAGMYPGQQFGISLGNGTVMMYQVPYDIDERNTTISVDVPVVRSPAVFCSSWDTVAKAWKDEGLGTVGTDGTLVCDTSHFTDFAAFVGANTRAVRVG